MINKQKSNIKSMNSSNQIVYYCKYLIYINLSILLIALISGCINKDIQLEDGTDSMVTLLDSITQNIDPKANEYANRAKIKYYEKIPVPIRIDMKINFHSIVAEELLKAGDTEKAIEQFYVVLDLLDQLDTKQEEAAAFKHSVKESIALSYLRLGEQQNCLINHTSASCLFPINSNGVHSLTNGSEKAIEYYEEILERDPDDMVSQWLLNIAYMTLGKHPMEVPEKWLIPPNAFEAEYDIKQFPDIASTVGLAEIGLSGGSITEDFNNDGFIDVVASSWGLDDQLHYYENSGNGFFTNKTKQAGLTGIVGGLNLRHADFNNDGYADILVLRGAWLQQEGLHPNSLLQNNGDGTFSDVTESAGLLSFHPTQTAEWADFNNDGWLDLFIGNESIESDNHPSELFLSQQDGTFKNIATLAGVDVVGYIKGVAVGDFNNNGLQDLYISKFNEPNILFENLGPDEKGIPRFSDVTQLAGVAEPSNSFPTWFWDFNNDGWLDIFVSGYQATSGDVAREYLGIETEAEMPRLYKNNGDGTFTDVATEMELNKIMYTMGSNFGDLDNDGYLDFYIGTGDPNFRSIMPNRMFRNNKGENFQEVTSSGGFGHLQKGHGVSFADLDNDGDQDIFTVIGGAFEGDVYMNALFENPGHDNHWITLLFKGKVSNFFGVGNRIKIKIETSGGLQTIQRVVSTGGSFGSSSLQQEIGLGDATNIIELEVFWPASGKKQIFRDIKMNHFYKISEDNDTLKTLKRKQVHFERSENMNSHH